MAAVAIARRLGCGVGLHAKSRHVMGAQGHDIRTVQLSLSLSRFLSLSLSPSLSESESESLSLCLSVSLSLLLSASLSRTRLGGLVRRSGSEIYLAEPARAP